LWVSFGSELGGIMSLGYVPDWVSAPDDTLASTQSPIWGKLRTIFWKFLKEKNLFKLKRHQFSSISLWIFLRQKKIEWFTKDDKLDNDDDSLLMYDSYLQNQHKGKKCLKEKNIFNDH
jgi:hypothetical protein